MRRQRLLYFSKKQKIIPGGLNERTGKTPSLAYSCEELCQESTSDLNAGTVRSSLAEKINAGEVAEKHTTGHVGGWKFQSQTARRIKGGEYV